jgi:hypothetical protein
MLYKEQFTKLRQIIIINPYKSFQSNDQAFSGRRDPRQQIPGKLLCCHNPIRGILESVGKSKKPEQEM